MIAPVDLEIAEIVQACHHDPLQFVRLMYPWGEPGTMLENHAGPDTWQTEFLTKLGAEVKARDFDGHTPCEPIRFATSSGHGVGKSTLVAWLVNWIMATRPHAQGTITANTSTQLDTKTWAGIQRWMRLSLCGHWFTLNSAKMYHPAFKESWFCTPQTCREENSEAFAGQHAADSTSFYIFDEDSAVPDVIHDVAEGGLTDGEPMVFLFGNCTRKSGKFYDACFGNPGRWHVTTVDARTCRYTNKTLIAEWEHDYGEDSDFFRVRVRGLPPNADDAQFIDSARITMAQRRPMVVLPDEPLIAGVDVPDRGPAWFVCRFRRGQDARSLAPIRLPGDPSPTYRQRLIAILAERLSDPAPERKIAAMFIDSAFGSPIVERLHSLGFDNVHEVRFGGESPDPHYANQRAYQWGRMKDWLGTGAIPPEDNRLAFDLTAPGFHLDKRDRVVLESKESMHGRNVASPDDGDALSLTFAQRVNPVMREQARDEYRPRGVWG